MLEQLGHALRTLAIATGSWLLLGTFTAGSLHVRGLRWTWALLGIPVSLAGLAISTAATLFGLAVTGLATLLGASWHFHALTVGGDHAQRAREMRGPLATVTGWSDRRLVADGSRVRERGLAVGIDRTGAPVRIPFGGVSGHHTLVVGATGSGKTVTQAWIASRAIEHGHGAIVIDPKGDRFLRDQVASSTAARGVRMLEWTPAGACTYNPYVHGGDSELADKALAGETFTEPHYLRQAQRYLGHAIRTMRRAEVPITPRSLRSHLEPSQLEATARTLDQDTAGSVHDYLDALTERQRRDLAGVRDRLSILAESDLAPWLGTGSEMAAIDLPNIVSRSEVAYFALEADRWPLLAQMIAAAIVSDLLTIAADLQRAPKPTLVLIDEFAAATTSGVGRLFARARSAGISLLLGTQELSDLATPGHETLREQVLGNISTLIAHRQTVPASADLVADIAGTQPVWVHTQRVDYGLLGARRSGSGTRTRGYEYKIHPSTLKGLPVGTAVVATPGREPPARIVRVYTPAPAVDA